ncbi:MAG: hypothetical protein ABI623_07230, partial [bacterium]
LPLSRYDRDSGGWFSGAIGYQTNGAEFASRLSPQVHWEYRTKESIGFVVGLQFWKNRLQSVAGEQAKKYESWRAMDVGLKFRFPLDGITPHFGFGTKLTLGWGIIPVFYYSVGFELPVLAWLHPTFWLMRSNAGAESFFLFTGVAIKL